MTNEVDERFEDKFGNPDGYESWGDYWRQCTDKQKSVISNVVDRDGEYTLADVSRDTGVSDSYVHYTLKNYGDLVAYLEAQDRSHLTDAQPIADGYSSEGELVVRFSDDEAFRAMKILPSDLASKVYHAARTQTVENVGGLDDVGGSN